MEARPQQELLKELVRRVTPARLAAYGVTELLGINDTNGDKNGTVLVAKLDPASWQIIGGTPTGAYAHRWLALLGDLNHGFARLGYGDYYMPSVGMALAINANTSPDRPVNLLAAALAHEAAGNPYRPVPPFDEAIFDMMDRQEEVGDGIAVDTIASWTERFLTAFPWFQGEGWITIAGIPSGEPTPEDLEFAAHCLLYGWGVIPSACLEETLAEAMQVLQREPDHRILIAA